jgi:hypothetical protein
MGNMQVTVADYCNGGRGFYMTGTYGDFAKEYKFTDEDSVSAYQCVWNVGFNTIIKESINQGYYILKFYLHLLDGDIFKVYGVGFKSNKNKK